MPRLDGTGPFGAGPRTGRGLGPCGGRLGLGLRRGFGRGLGLGLGRRFGFFGWRRPTVQEQVEALSQYEAELKDELNRVSKLREDLTNETK